MTPTVLKHRRERSETFDIKPMELMFRSMVQPEDDEDPSNENIDFDSKFYYRRLEGQAAIEAEDKAQIHLQRTYSNHRKTAPRDVLSALLQVRCY